MNVCICDAATWLLQRPLKAAGQSEPVAIDQWVSTLANMLGHDLSVANSMELVVANIKHTKH